MTQPLLLLFMSMVCLTQLASADLYRHYTFDTLIENGAAAPDDSTNKVHARLSGQELCEGVIGKALRFEAGNGGVVLGDLDLQAPATLSFWMKWDGAQSDGRVFSQLEGPTTQSGSLRLSGGSLSAWNVTGWPMAVNGMSDKGVWQHVAVVYQKDGTATGYLNGGKSGTFQSAFDFKGIKAGIAARFIGVHGRPFAGALDDFRIYSHALTEDEVKALYPPELLYPPTQVGRLKAAASKAGGWTLYPYHGPTAATAKWDEKAKALNLQKEGGAVVAGLSHTKKRTAADSVTMTVSKVDAPGKPWAQAGLMISSRAQPQLIDSTTKYEWLVRRESNDRGWDYRVRKDVGSGNYELYASAEVDPAAKVKLEIIRKGDNYEFRANGVLHYTTGKNPSDTYSVRTKDSMVYYGITFGGSSAMSVVVRDFGLSSAVGRVGHANIPPKIIAPPKPRTIDEDFETIVFAKPPQVTYPTALSASGNGDVYVSVDLNSVFDHKPNRGRIVKCRDTDGDGVADIFTDFVPDIDAPRGSCFVGDTLYVVHPPFLTAFRDTDDDGVADERELLIKDLGFVGKLFGSTGHTSNGVRMGIDGWLYLAIGDFGMVNATAKDGSTMYLQGGGVFRVRPDGTELELVTKNVRNIMDAAVSPRLDLFARDNNNDGGGWGVRFHHLPALSDMGYPRLYKNFPREHMQALAEHTVGSGTGAAFIDEPGIPVAFNNKVYTCDFSTRKVYLHVMEDAEATFVSEQQVFYDKRVAIDIDVDGSSRMYVCDWNNGNFSHGRPDVGRVTLIKPKNLKPTQFPDLPKSSDEDLLKYVTSQSAVLRTNAQHEILRRGPKKLFRDGLGKAAADESTELHGRIAALFTFKQLLGFEANATLLELAKSEAIREFALRALADRKGELNGVTTTPYVKGLNDPDPRVRLQSVIALSRLGDASAAPDILPLGVPKTVDHVQAIPHVAAKAVVSLHAVDACLKALADPTLRPVALRCLQEMHDDRAVDGLMATFSSTKDSDLRVGIMTALFRLYHKEKRWEPKVAKDWWHTRPDDRGPYFAPIVWEQSAKIKTFVEDNLNVFESSSQVALLVELKRNRLNPAELQLKTGDKAADTTLALLEMTGKNINAVAGIAKSKGTQTERVMAFDALAKIPSVAVTKAQLDVLDYWDKNEVSEPLLVQKKIEYLYSTQHVQRIAELERLLPKLEQSQQAMVWTILLNLHNSPLVAQQSNGKAVKAQLKRIIDSNQSEQSLIAVQQNLESIKSKAGKRIAELTVDEAIKLVMQTNGDAKQGQDLYLRQGCIACHATTLKEVPKGPFLGGVGNTFDRRFLAESILNPSASVAQGFQTQWIKLANGGHHEGFVTAELDGVIQLRSIGGVETKINAKDVKERGTRQESIMPSGLAANLTVKEFASLLDYLQSLKGHN